MTDNGIKQITDDIVQIRIPLPYALNHVNCYLIEGESGWTMVDSGLNTPEARSQWKTAFNHLNISVDDIEQIVLTHMHPDHFGMAGWWQAQVDTPMPVYLPKGEKHQADMFYGVENADIYQQWLLLCGMSENIVENVSQAFNATRDLTKPYPIKQDYIHAGEMMRMGTREFRMIHAPGHSDGQLIFYDETDELMLSGDHILMKITPNIGLWPHTSGNPLGNYLESLQSLADLKVRQGLPGHRWLITDWQGRIQELIDHHDERLEYTLSAIEAGHSSIYDIAGHIFPIDRFTPHEWRFAMAETLAHLELLERRGKLSHIDEVLRRYRFA